MIPETISRLNVGGESRVVGRVVGTFVNRTANRLLGNLLRWGVEVVRIVFGDGLDQSIGVVPGVLVGAFVHTGDMSLLVYKLCSAWGKGGLLRNPVRDAVLCVFLLREFAFFDQ